MELTSIRRWARAAAALAATVLMAACGTGRLVDGAAPVDRLTPGVTTVADATALLGPHTAETGYPNGQRLLQWGAVAGSPSSPAARRVAILFGEDGCMVGVIHAAAQQETQ
ncbi:hypothetical protein [Azohydromonas caseinilytica]|uniref:Uncharacterized protein n=1 Tax=Azohydromonas caseinilytica TaxID=2728836 RepID=A0A848FCH9_9BURK|nr:hypothetical protein [Azohydromonas caseinilytica]NML17038.1 hypothetical protein [Azohydromonas caseinilytica]